MTVGLVACCGRKLDRPAPARELYCSPLFRASVRWLEPRVDQWGILSALYGLVLPDEVIAPYDRALIESDVHGVRRWAAGARSQILGTWPADTRFVALAGSLYLTALDGLEYEDPLAGLGIGRRLQFLARGNE